MWSWRGTRNISEVERTKNHEWHDKSNIWIFQAFYFPCMNYVYSHSSCKMQENPHCEKLSAVWCSRTYVRTWISTSHLQFVKLPWHSNIVSIFTRVSSSSSPSSSSFSVTNAAKRRRGNLKFRRKMEEMKQKETFLLHSSHNSREKAKIAKFPKTKTF